MERHERVAEEIKKVISQVIQREISDPRLPLTTTVTDVKVSRDLAYATIFVSTLGDREDKNNLLEVMESAKGFMRRTLARELDLRKVPELRFKLDESIEQGVKMNALIDEVLARDAEFKRRQAASAEASEATDDAESLDD
ncbi:MAG: 30S ribosome-binding factor RbfA [Eubacteriales bacterium]|nr:30S ribosome-binding factor RbfA [Eubacteriales bacterium]